MDPRVMDAVGFIGQFVSDHWEAVFGHDDLKDALLDQGFSDQEISNAFSWIEDHTLGKRSRKGRSKIKPSVAQIRPPHRVLTNIEAMKIAPEAFGALLSLYERGVLNLLQFEEVIERAMRTPVDQVGSRQMKRLAALTLFNQVQNDWRDLLHSKSTLVQ
jgi:uncharacterized protein Smg (DUF494 family)